MVSDENSVWTQRFRSASGATSRLVCFPHAGGSASFFFPLSKVMPPSIDLLAVQYPGRQDRRFEKPVDDIAVLADRIAVALEADRDDLPMVFFGHSMGATVAFEVARRLEARGITLADLVVSGRRGPTAQRQEWVHKLGNTALVEHVRSLDGTKAGVLDDPEIVRMVLPVIRNDYKAAETYRYQPGPDVSCPITALLGDHDPQVTVDEAKEWAAHTKAGFDLHVFEGGHFYLNDHWPEVIECLRERTASAS
ncbi:thioesterase II family protein [Saccharopolyspora phatthalungensis]|uniref:Surfactin synthase thioesterase subunit n=1 Tax=Saccharopolyspora phatthalungensis TaxID=664693 RepID=A0A840QFL1_9PSEU|nr:alpha/beta fold hydrolase [Saccharopolyspora phatthalungensis]MBB5158867.1 surfactin synthase thioesterase subunit [Saccharopolyspora phatthalungensis]